MKKLFLPAILASTIFFGLTGCQEEEPDHGVTISGVPETMTLMVNESTGKMNIEVSSKDGLLSFKIFSNGTVQHATFYRGRTSLSTTFEYIPSILEVGKPVLLEFEAVDMDGDVAKSVLTLTILDEPNTVRISADIDTDQVWETGKTYILTEKISVLAGATLSIQKGVIVKADFKEEGEVPSLVIRRGAKIHAEGEEGQPIIFTTVLDPISGWSNQEANIHQQNWGGFWGTGWMQFDDSFEGYWGGLVIFGNARGSFAGDLTEVSMKENPSGDADWKYGGENDVDNSGFLKFVSIRNAGKRGIATKGSISALTLGAVGTGTIIENLEIVRSYSSAISILGGTVNLRNIFVAYANGDGIAIDQGWNGTLDNFYVGDSFIGINFGGPKGSYYNGNHVVKNGDLSYNQKLLYFEKGSNSDLSGLFFVLGDVSPFGLPDSLQGINLVPTDFSPKISNFEALITGEFYLSDLFFEWAEEVKLVPDYGYQTVGVDWGPFENWSLGYFILDPFL
jgi:hypothetical protein